MNSEPNFEVSRIFPTLNFPIKISQPSVKFFNCSGRNTRYQKLASFNPNIQSLLISFLKKVSLNISCTFMVVQNCIIDTS